MSHAAMAGKKGGGRMGRSEDASLLRELRRLFRDEKRAHSIGDDELAAKLAKRARELKRKREQS